jgi:hypothetical protein
MCKRFSDTYSQLKRFQLNDYRPNGHQNGTQQPAAIEINPCILLHQQKENANVRCHTQLENAIVIPFKMGNRP